ncbi:OLC1v1005755C1 [Oldenlandia corymbosa var. corymbosa]|nr:OLC1v1005755C1 [Oldenlandia corymbosa var. corymbosa]
MKKDVKNLVALVVDDGGKHHNVISIRGMGGLGKTTLARKVYQHKDVQRRFERFAWACVTQRPRIRSILQDILTQLLGPAKKAEVKEMEDREMVQQLHQVQKEMECLVVLDDIWSADDWNSLVAAFPIVQGRSKILFTTRDRKVAEIGSPYDPKFLTEDESWELLQKIAFSRINARDSKIDPELENVGKEMVHKCGGLPLAISVLGGILKDKTSLNEWNEVNKYVSLYLNNREDYLNRGVVARVLSLSYDELPYHLKPCFLYLACLKEDEKIDVEHLYHLWIAEGMVSSQHRRSDETLRDVAERYLEELAHRSLVQVRLRTPQTGRKYKTCNLHDMMRDLCVDKGREEEFIQVVDLQLGRQTLGESSLLSNNVACRLVLHMDHEFALGASEASTWAHQENNRQLRSILCVGKHDDKMISWPQGILDLVGTKSLRALQFKGYDFEHKDFPVDIQKMVHLRYLNITSCSSLVQVPPSIAELPFLQTLYIKVESKIKVPNVICKMKQLRHLYMDCPRYLDENGKLRLHGLTELETLWGVESSIDEVSDISSLLNLRFLHARILDAASLNVVVEHIRTNGHKLKEVSLSIDLTIWLGPFDLVGSYEGSLLKKLLMCGNIHKLELMVQTRKFPRYESGMFQNLVTLDMYYNKIEEDPMETLEMLPHLQNLVLGSDAYIGQVMACHSWGFPKLINLSLMRLSNLKCWRVEEGSMPKLSSISIWGCSKLEMIPDGLQFVRSLQRLAIIGMPSDFCERIRTIYGNEGVDYYRIKHVPGILVGTPATYFPMNELEGK